MLAALIDAAVIVERNAPREEGGPERGAKCEARGGEEPRGPTARRAGAGEHGWGARRGTGIAIASDPSGERPVRSRICKAGRPSSSAAQAGLASATPPCRLGACSEAQGGPSFRRRRGAASESGGTGKPEGLDPRGGKLKKPSSRSQFRPVGP